MDNKKNNEHEDLHAIFKAVYTTAALAAIAVLFTVPLLRM